MTGVYIPSLIPFLRAYYQTQSCHPDLTRVAPILDSHLPKGPVNVPSTYLVVKRLFCDVFNDFQTLSLNDPISTVFRYCETTSNECFEMFGNHVTTFRVSQTQSVRTGKLSNNQMLIVIKISSQFNTSPY